MRDGYLHIKHAVSRAEVAALDEEVDRLFQRRGADPLQKPELVSIIETAPFLRLVDHPGLFPILLELLGPYIQLGVNSVFVRVPNPNYKGFVHTDGGPALKHIRTTPDSRPLQVKFQLYLTDVSQPNSGNFLIFPGSHLRPFPETGPLPTPADPGTLQFVVEAGDAVFFPHSLWHGSAPNISGAGQTRKSIVYGYNQMFFRTYDNVTLPPELWEQATPRQKRLLGDLGRPWRPGLYFYPPEDQVQIMEGE